VESTRREAAYDLVRKQVEEGRQAFIVCPLVEESEAVRSRAAVKEYDRLSVQVFPDLSVGLLHGRMSLKEKEEVMERFQANDLDILVSTAVIEVGIDVPNATVMMIDGADRFGLAQLHQFRGRVGRGEHQSYCLLLSDAPGEEAQKRLKLLERVRDGFQLAEEDLKMRGPGDYLGTRQSGMPTLRVARITDHDILALARREATTVLDEDPTLSGPEHSALAVRLAQHTRGLAAEAS
jgi:ATP-dependent DNA helicase RecG